LAISKANDVRSIADRIATVFTIRMELLVGTGTEVSQGQKTEDCVKASLFKDLFPTDPLETLTTRATHA
jgi:hypothetical protein